MHGLNNKKTTDRIKHYKKSAEYWKNQCELLERANNLQVTYIKQLEQENKSLKCQTKFID